MDFDINAHFAEVKSSLVIEAVPVVDIYSAKPPNHTRFVCYSDTHAQEARIFEIPPGDVFIHAGDFTNVGETEEVRQFNEWVKSLPYQHKIVIAGNHDVSFDEQNYDPVWSQDRIKQGSCFLKLLIFKFPFCHRNSMKPFINPGVSQRQIQKKSKVY
jgi:3',5'-cyclic AMP phosphodiesterase CpdA